MGMRRKKKSAIYNEHIQWPRTAVKLNSKKKVLKFFPLKTISLAWFFILKISHSKFPKTKNKGFILKKRWGT